MRYKTLLLDLDGTLFDFGKSQLAAFFRCFPGADMEFYERYEAINRAQWKRLERKEATREEILHNRFALFFEREGIDTDPDEMNLFYLEELSKGCDLMDGAMETVALLSKHCTLAAVTNGVAMVQRRRLAESGLLPYFDTVVISEDIGVEKPDPSIFEEALRRCRVTDRSETLVVGDNLYADIAGGIAAGLDTCWIGDQLPESEGVPAPKWRITRPRELLSIVFGDGAGLSSEEYV